MMQHPELSMEERLERIETAVKDLERVFEEFAVRVEKRFDEINRDLRLILLDGRANNERISIVEMRLDATSERATLPAPEDK